MLGVSLDVPTVTVSALGGTIVDHEKVEDVTSYEGETGVHI